MPENENSDGTFNASVDDGVRKIDQMKYLSSIFCRRAYAGKLFEKFGGSLKLAQEPTSHPNSSI